MTSRLKASIDAALAGLEGEGARTRFHLDPAEVRATFEQALELINGNPGAPSSFDALDRMLAQQSYRLASWQVATEEINYRRFFDVNDLGGLRMEDPRVFAATHALLLELVEQGLVTGIRLDHPDGLYDPAAYFQSLVAAIARV